MRLRTILLALICLALLPSLGSAGTFPEKPVQLYVGFRAGGGFDTMGRILAEEMTKELGQPVIVQNKPGGGGNLSSTLTKNAPADGYTINFGPSMIIAYNPVALKSKYSVDDFYWFGAGARGQEAFVSLPDKPYNTIAEAVEWAKKNNQKLRYASMVPVDMAIARAITKESGVPLLPVPTKGGAAIMSSVLGGHVDFGYSGGIHASYVKAGRMKVLAALTGERLSSTPDVPTLAEQGWDLPVDVYCMVYGRKEIPEDVKAILVKAVGKAMQSEKFQAVAGKINFQPVYKNPAESADIIQKNTEVVKKF